MIINYSRFAARVRVKHIPRLNTFVFLMNTCFCEMLFYTVRLSM